MRRNKRFPLMDVASGIYGLTQARGIRKAGERAVNDVRALDPMIADRAGYARQLAQLSADPSRLEKTPGYQAGLQAVERKMASQGYLGSGNMMLALHNYGGEAFNREIARLAALASPSDGLLKSVAGAADTRTRARGAAADLTGRSLGSVGYGLYNMF